MAPITQNVYADYVAAIWSVAEQYEKTSAGSHRTVAQKLMTMSPQFIAASYVLVM